MLDLIYIFYVIWGLKHLDFSGYSKIYSDFTYFGAFWAYLGAYFGIFPFNFLVFSKNKIYD